MSTVPAPERERTLERTDQRPRGLTIAVVILAVIAVGLGGWLAFELQGADETALTADVQAVLDDYTEAFNAYDSDAFLALVTSDYRFYDFDSLGQSPRNAEETAAWMSGVLRDYRFTVEAIGAHQMIGDATSVQVTGVEQYTSTSQGATNGISVFRLVKDGDAWKIQIHWVH